MEAFRKNGSELFDDIDNIADYSKGIDGLPKENVLLFNFADGSRAAVRPSGTEPKLKLYYSVKGKDEAQAKARYEFISNKLKTLLQ